MLVNGGFVQDVGTICISDRADKIMVPVKYIILPFLDRNKAPMSWFFARNNLLAGSCEEDDQEETKNGSQALNTHASNGFGS